MCGPKPACAGMCGFNELSVIERRFTSSGRVGGLKCVWCVSSWSNRISMCWDEWVVSCKPGSESEPVCPCLLAHASLHMPLCTCPSAHASPHMPHCTYFLCTCPLHMPACTCPSAHASPHMPRCTCLLFTCLLRSMCGVCAGHVRRMCGFDEFGFFLHCNYYRHFWRCFLLPATMVRSVLCRGGGGMCRKDGRRGMCRGHVRGRDARGCASLSNVRACASVTLGCAGMCARISVQAKRMNTKWMNTKWMSVVYSTVNRRYLPGHGDLW